MLNEQHPLTPQGRQVSRRAALTGTFAAIGGLVSASIGQPAGAHQHVSATPSKDPTQQVLEQGLLGQAVVSFDGPHQAGIATEPQSNVAFVAFDVAEGVDREAVQRWFRIWTDDARRLTSGEPALADTEPELAQDPARLTITLGLGPGFFDAVGLSSQRPNWCAPLPSYGIDQLQHSLSQGDVLLQVASDDPEVIAHAVRMLTKDSRGFATLRWVQRGFRRAAGTSPSRKTMRNLMGQIDGTVNPTPQTEDFNNVVWIEEGPTWLHGGTSMVFRRIQMTLDTWDQIDRPGREATIGRSLDTGAPLTGAQEHDEPDFTARHPGGLTVIPGFAHIRRARGQGHEQVFRRSYNYDDVGLIDQNLDSAGTGLLFVAFQADLRRQYLPIQERLAQLDLLNTWTIPIGSGVYAIPRGTSPDEYWAQDLLEDESIVNTNSKKKGVK